MKHHASTAPSGGTKSLNQVETIPYAIFTAAFSNLSIATMDPAKRRVPISIEELIEKKEQEKNAANKVCKVQPVRSTSSLTLCIASRNS